MFKLPLGDKIKNDGVYVIVLSPQSSGHIKIGYFKNLCYYHSTENEETKFFVFFVFGYQKRKNSVLAKSMLFISRREAKIFLKPV